MQQLAPGGFSKQFWETFGALPEGEDLVALFSVRLDETGTDGRHEYCLVGGAVATPEQWDDLERKWTKLLERFEISAFHTKEFHDGTGEFAGWPPSKRKRFRDAQEKIIAENTWFRVAVAVDAKAHSEVKAAMRGTKNFKSDSDYGLAFRLIMKETCAHAAKYRGVAKVSFIVEDGPFAADAALIYQQVSRMRPRSPTQWHHGPMLYGFASRPKGALKSLEAADYIAGSSLLKLENKLQVGGKNRLFIRADKEFLLKIWHPALLRVKEHRRRHWKSKKAKPAS